MLLRRIFHRLARGQQLGNIGGGPVAPAVSHAGENPLVQGVKPALAGIPGADQYGEPEQNSQQAYMTGSFRMHSATGLAGESAGVWAAAWRSAASPAGIRLRYQSRCWL